MSTPKVRNIFNRNLVAIIIVPTIVAIHWICYSIQNNEKFVKVEERKELPIVRAARATREEILAALTGKAKSQKDQ